MQKYFGHLGLVILLAIFITSFQLFENVDADKILVVQNPISGSLTWFTDPGIKWQGMGKLTQYPKRSQYPFTISMRFNDGGHGVLKGSIQYEMPLADARLTALHTRFGSAEAIQRQLIETVVNKSVYMTGPLMSSKESYAEKRNYLISYVEDQITHGVYRTTQRDIRINDPLTGAEKTQTVVEIVLKDGQPARQEEPVLEEFGIKTFNFSIDELKYEDAVEQQIQGQQKITMQVQTAIADAKKAEQEAITAEKNGQAKVVLAKYEKEVEKIRAVTEAQQKLEVATLMAKSAEQYKRQQILEGEGDSAKKKLIMDADGALEKKLNALIEINGRYATAISSYQGNWVPYYVSGSASSGKGTGNGAFELVDLLTAKTAKELAIDLGASGMTKTKK